MGKISAKKKIKSPASGKRKTKNRGSGRILKKLSFLIKSSLSQSESFLKQWKKVRYWSQDESRMGLHTIQGRKLTGYGIKPQGKVQ